MQLQTAGSELLLPDRSRTTTRDTAGGAAPAVAVDLPLAPWLSLYARVYAGFVAGSFAAGTQGVSQEQDMTVLFAGVSAPFLVHATPHFFVGWGPLVERELARFVDGEARRVKTTYVEGRLFFGGWL